MITKEIYIAYNKAVALVTKAILRGNVKEEDLFRAITHSTFTPSFLIIAPALKEKYCQADDTLPISNLEKMWLKSIMEDPRIKLFGVEVVLGDNQPLFPPQEYKADHGDPFENKDYIKNFHLILNAIKEKRQITANIRSLQGDISVSLVPGHLEFSEEDNKFIVTASGNNSSQLNLGSIISCDYSFKEEAHTREASETGTEELTLLIKDEKSILEQINFHFSDLEKNIENTGNTYCLVRIKYQKCREEEMVTRVLAFGPSVKAYQPISLVNLIKERLKKQKSIHAKEY